MDVQYIGLRSGEFRPTTGRPVLHEIDKLAGELARVERLTFKHKPGDGIHFVPSPLVALYVGGVWSTSRRQSIGAILAHTDDLCQALGLNFARISEELEPMEWIAVVTPEMRGDCALSSTLADFDKVMKDLRAARFPLLAKLIEARTLHLC